MKVDKLKNRLMPKIAEIKEHVELQKKFIKEDKHTPIEAMKLAKSTVKARKADKKKIKQEDGKESK